MPIDWNQIREQYGPLVWNVAWRILHHHSDALDCSQEVFLEAFERSRRAPINDWAGFLRWLTTHRALDIARGRRRRLATDSIDLVMVPERDLTHHSLVFEELADRVRHELANVSQSQATAFWLVCVEEMSYREVAVNMQIKANAVGVLVHRARTHLKIALADECIIPESNPVEIIDRNGIGHANPCEGRRHDE